MKKSKKNMPKIEGDEMLPHPKIQETLLQMKKDGMLTKENRDKIQYLMMRERAIEESMEKHPGLTREEALEILEAFGG